ncbi:hypothetical protein RBSH_03192 [Rhodopirellula baltica SH28]|uniref:Uncharacterized protein n=1 Tax=Rhodopirellula baltica SH28 TaxID=993517 RepID=K5E6V7_RHOBT|nr:hypothetical protein RBSH_03192 [Rhodopirellula baltica SH28]
MATATTLCEQRVRGQTVATYWEDRIDAYRRSRFRCFNEGDTFVANQASRS